MAGIRLSACVFLLLLCGCEAEVKVRTGGGVKSTESKPPDRPTDIRGRVAALEAAGWKRGESGSNWIPFELSGQLVDLDTDDDGVHLTLHNVEDQAKARAIAEETFELLGLDLPGSFGPGEVTRGPIVSEAIGIDWTWRRRHWPDGLAGEIFWAWDAEKR